MRRVFVYVDGFNFFHALDDLGDSSLKWVNLWSLAESIVGPEETVVSVQYFSAYATWIPTAFAVHREYVKALQEEGVTIKMGNFKKKFITCKSCRGAFITHEEKETDVNIGIHLVADALRGRFDRAIVISADSDLATAVRLAKELAPVLSIDVAAPPGRFSHARDLSPLFEITKGRVRAARLREVYANDDGSILAQCPKKYCVKPPAAASSPSTPG